jgi:predicted nucleic acid-binding protein
VTVGLDTSGVIRWLIQEQNWQRIQTLMDHGVDLVLPGPVLSEVINIAHSRGNVSSVAQLRAALVAAGMRVEAATEDDMARAGELLITSRSKPETGRAGVVHTLSLGDALILAVAERLGCIMITGDRYWRWMHQRGDLPGIPDIAII